MTKHVWAKFAAIVAVAFMGSTASADLALLVNLGATGSGNPAATAADFAAADATVPLSASVVAFETLTGGAADSGAGITGTVSDFANITGGAFNLSFDAGGGAYGGDAILGNYWAASGGLGGLINVSDITGLTAGEDVTVTVYAAGDADDQDGSVSVVYDGTTLGPTATEADGTGTPYAQFTFAATSADSIRIENAGGASAFSAINGFSITTPEASAIPEPTAAFLLGMGGLFGLARRRR